MNLVNLKTVEKWEVEKWIENNIPNLTDYQKQKMRDSEMIRFAPFYFMSRRKRTDNVLLRFSIIFMLPVLLVLIVGLPFTFLLTGSWGYNHEKLKWYSKWVRSCGL